MDHVELYKKTEFLVKRLHKKRSYIFLEDLVHDIYLELLENPEKIKYFATVCKYHPINLKKYKYQLFRDDGITTSLLNPTYDAVGEGLGGFDDFSVKTIEIGKKKPIMVFYKNGTSEEFFNIPTLARATGVSARAVYKFIKMGTKGKYTHSKLAHIDHITTL